MNRSLRSILITLFLTLTILIATGFSSLFSQDKDYHDGIIRVKIENNAKQALMVKQTGDISATGIQALNELNVQFNAISMEPVFRTDPRFAERHQQFGLDRWFELRFDSDAPTDQIMQAYASLPEVEISEHKLRVTLHDSRSVAEELLELQNQIEENNAEMLDDFPDDPLFGDQWHYNNTGQTGGTTGADISLLAAWGLETGSEDVIVNVIDSGIQTDHPDLENMLWVNPVPGPDNGYDGDIHGWNFAENNPNIGDSDGHGTHVSGTVAAESNNGLGVAGVAGGDGSGNGVRIMTGRTFGATVNGGFGPAIVYGADNGAVISQNSWGYISPGSYEQSVLDAIDYFIEYAGYDENDDPVGPIQGGIVVFASGNSNSSADYYPGFYEPVVSVAASNHNDQKASYSNFGPHIDITAPGGDSGHHVVSTLPGNNYGANFYWGTSMAAPHVSGVVGLVASKYPGLTNDEVMARVLFSADDIDAENPGFIDELGSGRINAFRSLEQDDGVPPAAITDLAQEGLAAENEITLTWTAPGSSDDEGQAFRYYLRYSEDPITEENFDDAEEYLDIPSPQFAGETETVVVRGLTPQTEYYFAVKSSDIFSNVSDLSNVVSAETDGSPEIDVDPTTLSSTVEIGETEDEMLTITNTGEGLLTWVFPSYVNNGVLTSEHVPALRTNIDRRLIELDEEAINNRRVIDNYLSGRLPSPDEREQQIIREYEMDSFGFTNPVLNQADVVIEFEDLELSGHEFIDVTGDGYSGELTALEADFVINSAGGFTWASDFAIVFSDSEDLTSESVVLQVGGFSPVGDPSTFHPWGTGDSGSAGTPVETTIDLDSPVELTDMYIFLGHGYSAGSLSSWSGSIGLVGAVDAPEFVSSISPASGSLDVGESVDVTVTFDATEVVAGFYSAATSLRSNDLNNPNQMIELNMQTEGGEPDLVVSDTELEFGNVFQGESSSLTFNMANEGTAILSVSSVSIDDTAFEMDLDDTEFDLIPGNSKTVTVTFSPDAVADYTGTLTIESDNPAGDVTVDLSGAGIDTPEIGVDPEELAAAADAGDQTTETLTISNSGSGPLEFSLPGFEALSLLSQPGIEKNETSRIYPDDKQVDRGNDNRVGHPVILGAGGPDDFGNSWIDSNEPGGPSFNWVDISDIGDELTALTGTWDDNTSVDLPFDFGFYGESYGSATVSVNGWITFGGFTGGGFTNTEIPNPNEPNNLLAVFWDDLDMRTEGTVYTYHDQSANRFIIQWDGVPKSFDGGSEMTFQAILNANGSIVYQYYSMNGNLEANTVGIENADGTDGLQVAFNTSYVENGLAVRFASTPDFITPDITDGVIDPGESMDIEFTFDAANLIGGNYETSISIASNDPVTPVLDLPATFDVTGTPDIAVEPDELDFGVVIVGVTETVGVTVSNPGTDMLEVSSIEFDDAQFTADQDDFTLAPGAALEVMVTYEPADAEAHDAEMTISSNAGDVTVSLAGEGLSAPVPEVSVEELTVHAMWGDEDVSEVITISNSGAADLEFTIGMTYGEHLNIARDLPNVQQIDYKKKDQLFSLSTAALKAPLMPGMFEAPDGPISFEASEGFEPGFIGGQAGWSTFASNSTQPAITDENASDGDQSLELANHSGLGPGSNIGAFSPLFNIDDDEIHFGFDVLIEATGGADYDIVVQSPAQELIMFRIKFDWEGDILVVDDGFVNTGTSWVPNEWVSVEVDVDRSANTMSYYYDGDLIYQGEVAFADIAEQIVILHDNFNEGEAGFVDNIRFDADGGWMSTEVTSGVVAQGESMDIPLMFNTQIDAGEHLATLTFHTNDPNNEMIHIPITFDLEESVSITEEEIPASFVLKQNYPNPFNPSTTIRFGLAETSDVTLEVFNLLGQRVAVLVNENRSAGFHNVTFDASSLSSGMYIYRIQAGSFVETKKLMLVK